MREMVDEVAAALDLVVDEVESAIADVKAEARVATDDERFGDLDRLRGQLEEMRGIANSVGQIRERWTAARRDRYGDDDAAADEPHEGSTGEARRYLGRVKRGTRTPEGECRRPILSALVDLGGSAAMADVLDRVGAKMKGRLGAVDHEPLASNPDAIRWRNTAQWSRQYMVDQGLMLPPRRRGIWEISDNGRAWLASSNPSRKL